MIQDKILQDELLDGAKAVYERIIEHLNEKGPPTHTNTVLMVIIKNLLERVDTIQMLAKMGREESLTILTRAFLELQVSLNFILKDDTDKRANSYYLNSKIQRIENLIKMSKSDSRFKLQLNDEEIKALKKRVPEANDLNDYLKYYKKEWYQMFSLKPKRKTYRKWYALNWEYQSFKDIMMAVEIDESMYYFFYGLTSIDTHGMGAVDNIEVRNSFYKITGSVPSHLCYSIIETYLSNTLYAISQYYGLEADEVQMANFTKMAHSCMFRN
ncbi:hypothetical protein AM613_14105 [Listeria monocytogenes]|nr:hypothetical protein [Listeria monocytogenes]EAD9074402.1 hypothetical protein [Listeria monocytogenes]EAD9143658.1 hypothetical protein [Listeria monocytogenes]EAD9920591.1 hypothetical protein [Listeria monocytogenes]EAD9923721.1 hypothetical protein [Listeria monocytogenes]